MKVALLGKDGPVARATRATLERHGHRVVTGAAECAIYFPGTVAELEGVVRSGGYQRLVLRSHAYVYGSSTKNPGMMTEERISLLPPDAPEQRWLQLEAAAAKHPNCAALRLTNVLATEEGDLVVRQIARSSAMALAGHDPNVQFLTVEDAAAA